MIPTSSEPVKCDDDDDEDEDSVFGSAVIISSRAEGGNVLFLFVTLFICIAILQEVTS